MRPSGDLDLYLASAPDTSTRLGRVDTPAVDPSTTVRIQVQVTPSCITVTRLDTGHTMTVADGTVRGPYLHLATRGVRARFAGVTVS